MANWNIYDIFRRNQIRGSTNVVQLEVHTLKVALVTSGYTPDQNLHDFFNDANASEVSGTNYTAGGNAVANGAVTLDGSGNIKFDSDDPATWLQNAAGFSNARRAILYRDSGSPATSELICYSDDFGADKGNVAGDFSIAMDAAGIFTGAR